MDCFHLVIIPLTIQSPSMYRLTLSSPLGQSLALIPHLFHTWPLLTSHFSSVLELVCEHLDYLCFMFHLCILNCKNKIQTVSARSIRYHVEFLSAAVHLDWIYLLSLVRKYWLDVNDDLWNVFNSANVTGLDKEGICCCDKWIKGALLSSLSAKQSTERKQ